MAATVQIVTRFARFLLILVAIIYAAGVLPSAHDEVMERLTLGAVFPGADHALSHEGHHACNHSCHAMAHLVGAAIHRPATMFQSVIDEAMHPIARGIPREPMPPPTHPPKSA